jgi:hypothetical protein
LVLFPSFPPPIRFLLLKSTFYILRPEFQPGIFLRFTLPYFPFLSIAWKPQDSSS